MSVVTGDKELIRLLGRLPNRAANRLQAALAANHVDHKKKVIAESSLSPGAKRNMRFAIQVRPKSRRNVSRIKDVQAETFSTWHGRGVDDPDEGAAARIEKRIGPRTNRPLNAQFLLIPQGRMLTPTGRPRKRRVGGQLQTIDLSKEKNTAVIRTRSGKRLLVQRRPRRGRRRGRGAGRAATRPPVEVIGVLVRKVRQPRLLDFFGAWDKLAPQRARRYGRVLDDVLKGRI